MQESTEAESVSARDFVERELRANGDLSYAEIQARASRVGLNVPRFLYGSMRRALGLPPRPEGLATEAAPAAAPTERSPTERSPGDRAAPLATRAADECAAQPDAAALDAVAAAASESAAPTAEAAEPGPRIAKKSAFDFAVEVLRMSPDIEFQDLKARAAMAGLKMQPIVYGRAKALLGLVPTRPRRRRGEPPRLLRQVDSAEQVDRMPALDGIRSLEQLVETVRALEQERIKLRAALAAIQDTVDQALRDE
jgi:hypothetical protein